MPLIYLNIEYIAVIIDQESMLVVPGAALGRVPWVPGNPWISKTITKDPWTFKATTKEPGKTLIRCNF